MSFVPGTHFYRQKTKYTKPAPNPVPTTMVFGPKKVTTVCKTVWNVYFEIYFWGRRRIHSVITLFVSAQIWAFDGGVDHHGGVQPARAAEGTCSH